MLRRHQFRQSVSTDVCKNAVCQSETREILKK